MNLRASLPLVWLLASACATTSPTPDTPAAPDTAKPAASQRGASAGTQPQTEEQKTFYALGFSIGRTLAVFNLTPEETEYLRAGLYAQLRGEPPAVALEEYGPKISQLAKERSTARSTAEKERSKSFLEKAAQEPGAVKTESGLIYQEQQAGTGESPKESDVVTVHYRGTLIDGTEFDNSYKRGEPAQFPLSGVIRCWTEGVQRMKVGGKARLVCPSELAYGDRGAPPDIPGGATLVFEIELLQVTQDAP